MISFVGFIIPQAFSAGENFFYGTATFERLPTTIVPNNPTEFEIKLHYTAGSYALENLSPVIEVSPEGARSKVHFDVKPVSAYQNDIVRIPVIITVDPDIEYEKIFLSISYTGVGFRDVPFKSSWSDSIIFDIKHNIIKEIPLPADVRKTMHETCSHMSDLTKEEKEFWKTLHVRLIGDTPEFKSLEGMRGSLNITSGISATSCPPITRTEGTFISENGMKHKFHLGYNGNNFSYQIDTIFPPQYKEKILSPLKQFRSGVSVDEISCKEDLILITKTSNENPACVKQETMQKLIERGWGSKLEIIPDSKTLTAPLDKKYTVQVNDDTFEIRYSIIGSQLQEIIADYNTRSVVVNVEGLDEGHMVIEIPRKLIDARNGPDGKSGFDVDFFVLVDGSEVDFEETSSIVARTLTIPLKNGSSQIEIIGTVGYPYSQ
ncbi:hypothetical protein [Candidatus Nitrosotenuis sp. DW1]|uniref:hypothetical protein n=1 Tax=Candidatus Nitrosotenuis sp. DW1 TaxID=2259672 RepID=UPI0015C7E889|nr:hypothetical protein [Candidatus Nitrosotenuis sp. DW1]QLH08757.1 hypothetical protein DSQ19_04015 [Candidatus Nitrosotenuis sp. DW1]